MKFLGLGVPELVIILIVVLIIFGPKNLPKLGKAIGNGVKGLRKGVESGKDKLDKTIDEKFEEVEVEKAEEAEAAQSGPADDSEVAFAEAGQVAHPGGADEPAPHEAGDEPAEPARKMRRVVKKPAAADGE